VDGYNQRTLGRGNPRNLRMAGAGSYHMPRTCMSALMILSLISTFERQIFDFLGYMWLPILGNFFNIIFVIFGLFGLYQYRIKYLLAYSIWTLVWIAYNVFIICFYVEVGDLDKKEDILSFGAGSFSWWLVNSPGCQPVYNTTTSSASEETAAYPPRPSHVEGCFVRYEKIEMTHAAIQLVISTLGVVMSVFIIHYFVTVITPKMEKQSVKAMYSIEYSPQNHDSNPNTLERETELQGQENGDLRVAMTPRRVKRRSYRNSTRNSKSSKSTNHRQSGRSNRSSGRSHKSINPVTRLIDADQNRADSSTSNDAERYGQINPGFQTDNSRPNSIYNLSGPPTDIEASRPHSALTSYSNFHGQRRGPPGGAHRQNVTNLTQESLLNHEQNMNMDASYDDLPPPPPPLSSSPTPHQDQGSDSDNTSSVATAQLPVPQTRGSTRRNEYVNIPLQKDPSPVPAAMISHQEPEPQSPVSPTPPTYQTLPPSSQAPSYNPPPTPSSSSAAPPPVPPHNYANMPESTRAGNFNGARPRPTNPLYGKLEEPTYSQDVSMNASRYSEMDRSTGLVLSYEAETLRADTKLIQNGLYNEPYSLSDVPSQRSSHSEPYANNSQRNSHSEPYPGNQQQNRDFYPQPQESQYSQRPLPQSPRGQHQLDQNFTDQHGRSKGPPPPLRGPSSAQQDHHARNGHELPLPQEQLNRYSNVTEAAPDSGLHSMTSSEFGNGGGGQYGGERSSMRRVPNGHAARDRASLRLKQRREMENRVAKQKLETKPGMNGYMNGPTSLTNGGGHGMTGNSSGPASMPPAVNGLTNGDTEDKWYMKDTSHDVTASAIVAREN